MRWDEEVAKKEKVCPMTLKIGNDGRFLGLKCVGSECMAWRGSQHASAKVTINITNVGAETQPEPNVIPAKEVESTGYCGMAGQPEVGAKSLGSRPLSGGR